jgi:hypothetical protein
MIETFSGIVAALLIIVLTRALSKHFTTRLIAATSLVAIAFIYVGFSLKDNPVSMIILDSGMALIFYFMAIIGYMRSDFLIASGIILHGVWDIFHHNGFFIGTDLPDYWPSFCLTVDIIDGLYFLVIFKIEKNLIVVPETTNGKPV